MGVIIGVITAHQYSLQIIASILLSAFGVYVFRSNPYKGIENPKENINSYSQDIITAFFLTLSNPLIIFLFIPLFARFNFIVPGEKMFSISLGLISIISGALFWWFLITYFAGKLRKKMKHQGLLIMNKIIGSIIIILSVVLLFSTIFDKGNP